MRTAKIRKMAVFLGMRIPPEVRKSDMVGLIRTIQRKEGNFECFGTAYDYCDQEKCLFRQDCLVLSKINEGGRE